MDHVIGIDVSKARLDVYDLGGGRRLRSATMRRALRGTQLPVPGRYYIM